MHEARQQVAVIDNVLTEARGAGAVKSRAADLSVARDDEVTAGRREQSYAESCRNANGNTQRHEGSGRC